MSEPRTAAGRALYDKQEHHTAYCASWELLDYGCNCGLEGLVAAIEQEAAALAASPAPAGLDVERLARAMRASDGVNWPKRWEPEEFDWVARQIAREYDVDA